MGDQKKIFLFYGASVLFLLLNLYAVVNKHTLLLNLLPIVLAVVLTAVVRLDVLLLAVVFLTPLSLALKEIVADLPYDMNLPTEPLMAGILLLFIFKLIEDRGYDKEVLKHPVSITLYLYLGWMLVTSLTSTMPVVSLKFWLAKIWFLAAFYFLGIPLYRERKNIFKMVWLYCGAFLLVIFYAWFRHMGYGFHNEQAAHFVMNPFYKDHTSYGAMLAFFIPFLLGVTFFKGYKRTVRFFGLVMLLLFCAALILSYTRAAWLSLVVAAMVWGVLKLKIRFRPLFVTFISVLAIVFVFQSRILMMLEQNDQESSANLANHLSSMTNVTSDASNLERINRWNCAIRMWEEKPVFGWGPGTYMFQYAPFQLTKLRTIISTNSANRGNAHSEYLGPLAESGLLGMISFLLVAIVVIYTGVHVYTRASEREIRMIILASITGIVTYLVHGFLNNFLDTDKASVPFWSFVAIIVVFDLYTKKKVQSDSSIPLPEKEA